MYNDIHLCCCLQRVIVQVEIYNISKTTLKFYLISIIILCIIIFVEVLHTLKACNIKEYLDIYAKIYSKFQYL